MHTNPTCQFAFHISHRYITHADTISLASKGTVASHQTERFIILAGHVSRQTCVEMCVGILSLHSGSPVSPTHEAPLKAMQLDVGECGQHFTVEPRDFQPADSKWLVCSTVAFTRGRTYGKLLKRGPHTGQKTGQGKYRRALCHGANVRRLGPRPWSVLSAVERRVQRRFRGGSWTRWISQGERWPMRRRRRGSNVAGPGALGCMAPPVRGSFGMHASELGSAAAKQAWVGPHHSNCRAPRSSGLGSRRSESSC